MRTAVYRAPDEEEHFRRYRFGHEANITNGNSLNKYQVPGTRETNVVSGVCRPRLVHPTPIKTLKPDQLRCIGVIQGQLQLDML